MKIRSLLLFAFIAIAASGCATSTTTAEKMTTAEKTTSTKPIQDSVAFALTWLGLLDSLAPVQSYLPYLPDGDFEQWSYPEAEIKNTEQLKLFFAKSWGMITSQSNQITKLTVSPLQDGRSQIEIDVNWSATTANGQSFARPLHYSLTVGPGSSAADPAGVYLKVFRYQMTRPKTQD
jgi:hypothetical protein